MDRIVQWTALACIAMLLAACGTMRSSVLIEPTAAGASAVHARAPGGTYTVTRGDTLYSIAFRQGVDFRDLAQWNAIAAPYTIWPGQALRLSPPPRSVAAAPATAAAPGSTSAVTAPAATAPAATGATTSAMTAPAGAGLFEPVAPTPAATAPAVAAAATATAPAQAGTAPSAPGTPPASTAAATATATAVDTMVPVAGSTAPAPAPVAPPPPTVVPAAASRSAGGLAWRWPAVGTVVKRFQADAAIPGIEIAGRQGEPVRAAADGVVVYSGNGLVGYGELVIIKHNDSLLSAYAHNSKRLVKEGQRVSAGQQIAEMGSTGASRVALGFQVRKDGNPVDPLSYLPPR